MNNNITINGCMKLLASSYPYQRIEDATLMAYGRQLEHLDPVYLEMAIYLHNDRSEYFPKIKEIKDAYADIVLRVMGVIPAIEAWGKVAAVITNGSRCNRDDFSDLTWQVIKDIGGWSMLKNSQMPASDRKQFLAAYDIRLQREREDMIMMPEMRRRIGELAASVRQPKALEQPIKQLPALTCPYTEDEGPTGTPSILSQIRAMSKKMTLSLGKSNRAGGVS